MNYTLNVGWESILFIVFVSGVIIGINFIRFLNGTSKEEIKQAYKVEAQGLQQPMNKWRKYEKSWILGSINLGAVIAAGSFVIITFIFAFLREYALKPGKSEGEIKADLLGSSISAPDLGALIILIIGLIAVISLIFKSVSMVATELKIEKIASNDS